MENMNIAIVKRQTRDVMNCPKYHQATQRLISQLGENQITLNLHEIMQRGSGEICFYILFSFLKITGLIKII